MLEAALNDGVSRLTGEQIGLKTGDPRKFESYDEVWGAFKKQVDVLRGVPVTALSSTPVSSGHDPAKGEEPEEVEATEVDEKVAQMLEAGGVKVVADFSKAQNAADAKAIFEAAQKKTKTE